MASKPGCIAPEVLYTLDEARARLRLGEAAMRTARRQGLPVHRAGGRAYVLGAELIAYIVGRNGQGGDA